MASDAEVISQDDLQDLLVELKVSEDFAEPYFERAKLYYKLTRLFNIDEPWPYSTKISTPDTLSFVEDTASSIFNTLFGAQPFIRWKPTRGFSQGILTEALDAITAWLIESNYDQFMQEAYSATHIKVMYGTNHFGVFPKYDKFRKKERVCVGADFIAADFWDLIPCPQDVVGGNQARYQWWRQWMTTEEVKQAFEDEVFEGDWDRVPKQGGAVDYEWHKTLLAEVGWTNYVPGEEDLHEVMYRFSDGHVITIVNRGYIVQDTLAQTPDDPPYPYNVPFLDQRYIIFPKEYWGMGIPESIEQLARDKNLIRSQHRENADMNLNSIVKVARDGDVDLDTLEFYPGAIWMMEDPKDVEVWSPPDVTSQTVIAIENQIMEDMERATGRSRYSKGETPPHARETATTVMRLQQAGASRIEAQIRITEAVTVRGLAWQLALIASEKLDEKIFEQVTGKTKKEVFVDTDKWELKYQVDARPTGSSISAIKELRTEQLLRTLEVMKDIDPLLAQKDPEPFRLGMRQVLHKLFMSLGMTKEEADETVPKIEKGKEGGAKEIGPGELGTEDELAQVEAAGRAFGQGGVQ
jgi:hypothetical protein